MPKPPKAKIQKAHNLSEQVLVIWQQDIRDWAYENRLAYEIDDVNEAILMLTNWFRQARIEAERP